MFHLGGTSFPTTREQLIAAVTDGLRDLLALPTGREVVKIEGGAYPAFERVMLDLTGARSALNEIPPEPRGTGQRQTGVSARRLEITGRPLYLRETSIDLSLTAEAAKFDYDRDGGERPVLVLTDATHGQVAIQTRKQDLDALVLAVAREAVKPQGVQVLETNLTLTQLDERSVAADVRVKAKKLFITATLHLRGKLSVDDELNARISELACIGEGMLGEMASGMIRPRLAQVNDRTFPLTAFSLGQVRLHDLRMQVGDVLKLTAAFGN